MALIRGVGSLHPCPRCLIHHMKLKDLTHVSVLRTTENMKAEVQRARTQRLLKDKEEILKSAGLREVDVRFPPPRL